MSSGQGNPYDPSDGGRWGENHTPNEFGGQHNTLYRGDSHISWDTGKDDSYIWGSGHTVYNDSKEKIDWD